MYSHGSREVAIHKEKKRFASEENDARAESIKLEKKIASGENDARAESIKPGGWSSISGRRLEEIFGVSQR